MGALLFIDKNTKPIIGVYSSAFQTSSNVSVQSTDNSIDGEQHSFNPSTLGIGVYLGFKNNYHRLTLSYDTTSDEKISQDRLMFNLDFYDTKVYGLQPLFGIGIGSATNEYKIHNKNIKQSNGVANIKAGLSWNMKDNTSLDLILEYAKLLTNNVGKSISENSEFTTYNISKRTDSILRLGYCREF